MVAYIIFVVLDAILTSQVIVPVARGGTAEFYENIGRLLFILVFPFMSILSPMYGIAAMISCRTQLY